MLVLSSIIMFLCDLFLTAREITLYDGMLQWRKYVHISGEYSSFFTIKLGSGALNDSSKAKYRW